MGPISHQGHLSPQDSFQMCVWLRGFLRPGLLLAWFNCLLGPEDRDRVLRTLATERPLQPWGTGMRMCPIFLHLDGEEEGEKQLQLWE